MNSFVLRFVVLLTVLVGSAFAGDINYTDNGADHLWSNTQNWNGGTVPADSLTGASSNAVGTLVQITGGIDAICKGFMVGMYGKTNSAEISGGTLSCTWLDVGRCNANGGNGSLEITGGEINVSGGLNIPNQFSSMTDPAKMGVGHIDLLGGTITCGSFQMGNRMVGAGGGIGTLDVGTGILRVSGNKVSVMQGYINNGWITAYGGIGDFLLDYDQRTTGMTTLSAIFDGQASVVVPNDKEVDVIDTLMVWEAGDGALSHNVNFGTVNPPPYIQNQLIGDEDYDPGQLEYNTTYYWRIDEVTDAGVNMGVLWSLTTGQLPGAAELMRPADGQTGVKGGSNVIWTGGDGVQLHDVYFGVSFDDVSNASDPDVLPGRGTLDKCFYDPGQLQPETTYYLRIDERNKHGVTRGAVWSFTTSAAIEGDINFDGVVDMDDLNSFAYYWLNKGCVAPAWCDGADLSESSNVDLVDYALLSTKMGPDENEPDFTDYCAMLSQEIQGKKHGFLAGNLTYYIGGFYPCWDASSPKNQETIGFTHPFHHDLRSRGHGMVQEAETGYGHDYSGWEFYKQTKVAYGSVYVGGTKYENPVPVRMYWRPDKMICEYEVGGVNIREEKFIAGNDVACTIITSDAPITLEFAGQSFANRATVTSTATCRFDAASNSVHVVEGGTAEIKPQADEIHVGVMMYDGMSTVISSSRTLTDYQQNPINDEVAGQWGYSFKVPCDSEGTSLVWMMDDDYSKAVACKDAVLADPAAAMADKTKFMNDILNYQIPYFRCSDQQMVDVYYYLWSLYFMYYIDVGEGFEQYPHTQTAVNNFLGMHRYDAHFQTAVGAWTTDKDAYANGNVLIWSELLEFANLETGRIPADNMGIQWYSGLWGGTAPHVVAAWTIYEHSGDLVFLRQAYDYFKALMWKSIPGHWGYQYDAADRLAKMAVELGQPEDSQHWLDLVNMDNMDNWLNAMWEKNGVEKYFGAGTGILGWSGMAYMAMDAFPDEWAQQMTDRWAVNEEDGFFHFGSISTIAYKDWAQQSDVFTFTPDTNWFAITGMYEHHACGNANKCTLGHLKNYNLEWGIPVAPESLDINGDPWGDEYSNFNAGKILLFIEGILGLKYSVIEDSFTVSDHLPMEWDFMETIVPINEGGKVRWTKVRTSRSENGGDVEKTITVEGNSMSTLNVQPWLEEKALLSSTEQGYETDKTKGHIDYSFTDTSDVTITLQLE